MAKQLTAEQARILGKKPDNVTPMSKRAVGPTDKHHLQSGDLSAYFGIEFAEYTGAVAIAEFAARNPKVMEHDVEGGALRFGGEDFTCIIHHDLDENLDIVFQGVVRTYCPQRDQFTTPYRKSIEAVLELLRGYLTTEHVVGKKGK